MPLNKTISFKSTILWLAVLLLLGACASVVAPTGGKKDETDPKLKEVVPPEQTVNFSSEKVVFTFDEYIQLLDKDKQLVISPIIEPAPTFEVKGKKLTITFKKKLKDNTTYTINFGNAVADLHESNPLAGFRYVFSTGTYVDTLFVRGNVVFAENLKSEKGILVMLYTSEDDSLPYNNTPAYFARTDESGNFSIKNIAHGPYKIFALKDADNNYKYNQSDEWIAFDKTPVIGGDSTPVNLRMFKEADKKIFVKESKTINAYAFSVLMNKPVGVLNIEPLQTADNIKLTNRSKTNDTLVVWLKDSISDTLSYKLSSENNWTDTLTISKPAKALRGHLKQIISLLSGTNIYPGNDVLLKTTIPVASVNKEKVLLMRDSTASQPFEMTFSDSASTTITIKAATAEKNDWKLTLLPGALTDIYGNKNDTVFLNFHTNSYTDYGSIKIKVDGLSGSNYLLQLVDEKDMVISEKNISGNGSYLFEKMLPAKCKVRIINDADGNNVFTTGNYLLKQLPELVYYYKETLTLRANWDIEISWSIKEVKQ
jgi:hypothetical protein